MSSPSFAITLVILSTPPTTVAPMSDEITYAQESTPRPRVREQDIESAFIDKLRDLKYTIRPDIHDRASLEQNFRIKFEELNHVKLTDAEFVNLYHFC